jgi:VWFA-related protein
MRTLKSLAIFAVLAAAAGAQAPAGPQQNPPPQATVPQQNAPGSQQPPTANGALRTNTRLITVDVVATDSHGHVMRGLKPEDFQVSEEHAGQQKIVQFSFVDAAANSTPAPGGLIAPPPAPYLYTNLLPQKMRIPPTVMLMDALNTNIQNQSEVHQQMVMLLKSLPASTPIAVFTLGHNLHILQNFTTDPALLRAAVDHTLRVPDIERNAQDDANSASNVALDQNGGNETQAIQALEDFEKVTYEAQMSIRVDETTDAMVSIAKFLGGYPGRKNLLWFSESFPEWIAPNPDFGADPFQGTGDYTDKIRKAYEALTDARIAVYPVDARGLEANQITSASSTPQTNPQNPGGGFGGQLSRENGTRIDTQATMEEFAMRTGGKTCENTNDLSGCVQAALDDSSAYYELAYYPENVKWDGKFHKITVKSNQHGIKLRYRTGYFATEPGASAKLSPDKLLEQVCMDPLSSTAISLTVTSIAPKQQSPADAGSTRYLLTISPSSLTLVPASPSSQLNVQMAICEYTPKGDSFQIYPRNLSRPVSDAVYQAWKSTGYRNIFDYDAKPENRRLRFAVLDVPSGAVGSVDVPAHPTAFGGIPVAGGAPGPAPASSKSAPSAPAAAGTAATPPTHVAFHASNGASGMLDWGGDSVTYRGDLGLDLGAQALFGDIFGRRYHCDAGNLVANDVTFSDKPNFVLTLRKPGGTFAQIDLGGGAPAYSGDVPIDASARAFFDYIWKLCHCQQP